MRNYYQILEVPSDAPQEAIKEQYRFLIQAWHPDKFPISAQKIKAEEKTKEINEAYAVLSNPVKRAEYDKGIRSPYIDQERETNRQPAAQPNQRHSEQHKKEEQPRKEHANRERNASAITVSDLVKSWKQISASLLDKDLPTSALLNSVKMIDLQGNTLVLGFASEVLISKMKTKQIELTRKAVFDMLGVMLEVRCVVVNNRTQSP